MENKQDWEFERSSGYAGYRNKVTSEWIYEEEYLNRFREVENWLEAKALEFSKQFLNNGENSAFEAQAGYLGFLGGHKLAKKEFKEKIDKISLSNKGINSFGDGFEHAMSLIYKEL